jgi:uncharacterized Fe-S cluster-containing radical SAM superfamily protein
MYDPIQLSKKIENLVLKKNLKKYYRFRSTCFYNGIATADTVGCNLRCVFCWSDKSVWNVKNIGKFYTPNSVAEKLQKIANDYKYRQLRISGGEPTIGKNHLLELLELIEKKYLFILETNGILLGYSKSYVEDLSKFNNLHVRVCLKGSDLKEFRLFTNANRGFNFQLNAIKYLNEEKISFNIAIVSNRNNKKDLYKMLSKLCEENIFIEEEDIKLYPKVKERLEKLRMLELFM